MKLKTTWNTGRQYTQEGQVIQAVHVNGETFFYDRSRMITGTFLQTYFAPETEQELQAQVMAVYDRTAYDPLTISEFERVWKGGES